MITFEIGGRKVSPGQFGDAISKAVLENVKSQLESKVKSKLTLSERNKVKITVSGRDVSHLSIKAEGPDDVLAKLKGVLGIK